MTFTNIVTVTDLVTVTKSTTFSKLASFVSALSPVPTSLISVLGKTIVRIVMIMGVGVVARTISFVCS